MSHPSSTSTSPAPVVDGSPWSDAPPACDPIHWHASRRFDSKPRLADAIPTLLAGYMGAVVAGGFFALSLVAFFALLAAIARPSLPSGTIGPMVHVVLGALVSVVVGFGLAAITGMVVFPLFALVVRLAGLYRWRAVAASCAGGWTGFAAFQLIFGPEPRGIALTLGAMAFGQVGAGWNAHRAKRREFEAPIAGARPSQFSLRQLLGLMAAVSIVAAILAGLPLTASFWGSFLVAAVLQFVIVAAYLRCTRPLPRLRIG